MGEARSPGVSLRSTARLNLDFSLREKIFVILYRVAVGAAGRQPALQGVGCACVERVVLLAVPHQNFREKHRRYTGGNLQNDKEVVEGFLGKSLLYLQKMNLLWNYDDKR